MDFKKEISNAMGGGAGGDKDNKDNKSGGGDDAKQYVDKAFDFVSQKTGKEVDKETRDKVTDAFSKFANKNEGGNQPSGN